MAKYHVNPETGNANVCRARKNCPFGGDEAHYPTKEAARQAYELSMDALQKKVASNSPAAGRLASGGSPRKTLDGYFRGQEVEVLQEDGELKGQWAKMYVSSLSADRSSLFVAEKPGDESVRSIGRRENHKIRLIDSDVNRAIAERGQRELEDKRSATLRDKLVSAMKFNPTTAPIGAEFYVGKNGRQHLAQVVERDEDYLVFTVEWSDFEGVNRLSFSSDGKQVYPEERNHSKNRWRIAPNGWNIGKGEALEPLHQAALKNLESSGVNMSGKFKELPTNALETLTTVLEKLSHNPDWTPFKEG